MLSVKTTETGFKHRHGVTLFVSRISETNILKDGTQTHPPDLQTYAKTLSHLQSRCFLSNVVY